MTTAQPPDTRPCAVEGCKVPNMPASVMHTLTPEQCGRECGKPGNCDRPYDHHPYVPAVDPREELIAEIRRILREQSETWGSRHDAYAMIEKRMEKYDGR